MMSHYESHGVTLYVADARELLPTFARESVELLLTNPPYGVRATATGMRARPLPLEKIQGDDSEDIGRAIVALSWPLIARRRHAYVFGPFSLADLPDASGVCELVWDKVWPTMGDLTHPWAQQHEKSNLR